MQINPQLANCQVNDVEFGVYLFLFPGPRSKFSAIIVDSVAGWSSLVARWAHNPKVVGSNPAPATLYWQQSRRSPALLFLCRACLRGVPHYNSGLWFGSRKRNFYEDSTCLFLKPLPK